jgi:arsenate reductase
MLSFVCYEKCSTCKKARAFLTGRGASFVERDIKGDNPTKDELAAWLKLSGAPLRRMFNTSGMLYREMGLSKRLDAMDTDEALSLLATDGMLVKRPILIGPDFALFGFREDEWAAALHDSR